MEENELVKIIPRNYHDQWHYEAPDMEKTFRRMVSAIAFPWGANEGISVFFGVEKFNRVTMNEPVFWIDEVEHTDLSVLLEETQRRVRAYSCESCWGNTRNNHFLDELVTWNRRREDKRKKRLDVNTAPRCTTEGSLLPFYGLLRDRGREGEPQTIFLSDKSVLPNALSEILPDVAPGLKDIDNPPAAALCYLIGGVDETTINPWEEDLGSVDNYGGDYNVLGYMNS